jgi:S1-C subfamily serine protease
MLLAILLAPVIAGSAAAQAPGHSGAGTAAPRPQVTSAPPRRERAFTGLDVRYSASMDANRVVTKSYPIVAGVEPGSPGHHAGVLAGDVIIEVNGGDSRVDRAMWLQPGVRYTLRLRNGEQEREVVLVPLPPRDPPAS